jgi:site-specific DNA recombinase
MSALPCAVYTRKSSEEGLEQGFNSLDAQREACEAYILSQKAQGWRVAGTYDDGGYSGGNVERPALQRLLADISAARVRVVVVYKVDRLTRSLADFAKLVDLFDAKGVSFVSVTQQFNTTTSMGRLTLNVLLSFAQFEREVTGERIRDKIAASKRKGMWMGGFAPLGYRPHERSLLIDVAYAERVREMHRLYLELGCVRLLKDEVDRRGWKTPARTATRKGGDRPFSRGHLYRILANPIYAGRIAHKDQVFEGQHPAIVDEATWQAVQAQLARNAQVNADRSNAAEPSPLAGLVFDDQGLPLRPTHTKNHSRRYRYYVREAASGVEQSDDGASASRALRVPAPALEGTVTQVLISFLRDPQRLLAAIGEVDAVTARRRIDAAAALAGRLASATTTEQVILMKALLSRVEIARDMLRMSLRSAVVGEVAGKETFGLDVPMALKRSGQAVRLILRGPDEGKAQGPNPRLIALLAKAQRWFAALSTGQQPSVMAIAAEHGMASSDVTNTVYLAFLAPDIVERVVAGDHPAWLGTKRLLAMAPLPLDWAEQRRVLGMGRTEPVSAVA